MDPNNFDTSKIWKLFSMLLNFILFLILIALGYLLLEDQIKDYLHKPSYTPAQLKEMARQGERQRRQERNENWDLIENGIHVQTGLKADEHLPLIISNCTSCHSAKLITQNRATRAGWKSMIDWMQETQGLHDLGDREPIVLNYLAKYYAPQEIGRRANIDLDAVEWYILDLE